MSPARTRRRDPDRLRRWYLARIECDPDPRHQVAAVTDYLRAVLARLPASDAGRFAERFVDTTLELIDAARPDPDDGEADA